MWILRIGRIFWHKLKFIFFCFSLLLCKKVKMYFLNQLVKDKFRRIKKISSLLFLKDIPWGISLFDFWFFIFHQSVFSCLIKNLMIWMLIFLNQWFRSLVFSDLNREVGILVNNDSTQRWGPLQNFELSFLKDFLNILFSNKIESKRLFRICPREWRSIYIKWMVLMRK